MSIAFVDLEANGLLYDATKVHCVCFITDKGTEHSFTNIQEALAALDEFDTVVAHNGSGYDFPLLKKLFNWEHSNTIDTMIYSRLYEPDRFGGHSIEQYAKEFGMTKVGKDITDWSTLTDEMLDRCLNDARVGKKVFEVLNSRMTNEWHEAIDLETRVAEIHAQQVLNGVLFDMGAAETLAEELEGVLAALEKEILVNIPLKAKKRLTTITAPFKMDGTYKKSVLDWYGEDCDFVFGDFNRVEFEALNLDSPTQVKTYLLTQGWTPIEYTEKGSPKLTEESYASIKGELGQLIAKRNVVKHRRNMIKNTNKAGEQKGFVYKVRKDGRIAADAITLGAATGRYAHKVVANLPRVTTSYGKEIRGLFTVPKGKVMIGWDLAGIENRVAAHYLYAMDGGKFAKQVLHAEVVNGIKQDFHQQTADANGITRDEAKTFRYMVLYGGAPKKIAATMGWNLKKAKDVYTAFWKQEFLLKRLAGMLEQAVKSTGSLRGLDGRRLKPRSTHALLNFLFQSAATIIFKRAMVIMHEKVKDTSYLQLIAYHDEIQGELYEKEVDKVSKLIHASVREAGEFYNIQLPIECEIKVGMNWQETH